MINVGRGQYNFVLGIYGRAQGNGSVAVLLLIRHQCSIHCENSSMANGASRRR